MGEAEVIAENRIITITSHLITYGSAACEAVTALIAQEIEALWNEPNGTTSWEGRDYDVRFRITAELNASITELEVLQNTDARNNYFRIETYAEGNISFVDGLGCNTGYLKLENLYAGSTTAAHEYGHTLGLAHPLQLDIRGRGRPGIMYPRGTLVDPEFQYDHTKPAGVTGGTLNPVHRRVQASDIEQLQLHKLRFKLNKAILGDFTNVFHWPQG